MNSQRTLFLTIAVFALTGCQAAQSPARGPSFEQDPTASGSHYSEFNLPGERTGMQNVDLED